MDVWIWEEMCSEYFHLDQ